MEDKEHTSSADKLSDEKSPEPTEWFTFCSYPLRKQITLEDVEGFDDLSPFKSVSLPERLWKMLKKAVAGQARRT